MGVIVFGGLAFDDYGVIVDSIDTWKKPERDRTLVHVPGRNGDLILDNGCYKNVDITYHCMIKDDWKTTFQDFVKLLYEKVGSYYRLSDSNHPGVYRMAEFSGGINPDLVFATSEGRFDITFNCKPQLYLGYGGTNILDFTTQDAMIQLANPYGMVAYPTIRIDGATSGARLYIDGGAGAEWEVKVAANAYDGIIIDCESEICYAIDQFGDYIANANNLLTIAPDPGNTPSEKDFPFSVNKLDVIASHTDGADTYTGTAEVIPNFTRI